MGQVLQFRLPLRDADDLLPEIDLVTAVDVALRDIADAIPHVGLASVRAQLSACYDMLQAAFEASVETD
jgi:phage gp29-like protein